MASSLKTMQITYGRGVGALAAGTLVGFGASVSLGTLYGKYRDKWWGQWMPAFYALVGKALAVGVLVGTKGKWHVTGTVLDSFGQAGVNALGLDLGVKAGLKLAGKQLVVKDASAALGPGETKVAGDLPPAQPGRSLAEIDVEDLANLR